MPNFLQLSIYFTDSVFLLTESSFSLNAVISGYTNSAQYFAVSHKFVRSVLQVDRYKKKHGLDAKTMVRVWKLYFVSLFNT